MPCCPVLPSTPCSQSTDIATLLCLPCFRFLQPVKVPEYYSEVKQPMDLGTILSEQGFFRLRCVHAVSLRACSIIAGTLCTAAACVEGCTAEGAVLGGYQLHFSAAPTCPNLRCRQAVGYAARLQLTA